MKKILAGLIMSMSCLLANQARSQEAGKTVVEFSTNTAHSEFVLRFASPHSTMAQLPSGTNILSKHPSMNILVVRNENLKDDLFLDLLQNVEGVVRIETANYDEAGSPVYPTGVAIVTPNDDSGSRQFCRDLGCSLDRELPALGWYTVLLPVELSYADFADQAKESGLFASVMRDEIITAHSTTSNDPLYTNCWYIFQSTDKDIDADQAWDIMPANASVKNVAVIDGHGFDTTHPDMTGNWADTFNAVDGTTNVMPENAYDKHGTSCAGIPGAEYNNSLGTPGLGKNLLQVQAIKVGYNIQSSGSFYTSSTIEAAAIDRVIANNNSVTISMSFGSTSYQAAFLNAISSARTTGRNGKGIVVFASTGNDGVSTWTNYPASYAGVIAVGATSSSDTRSSFSNYGAGVTLSAPGSGITTIDIVGATGYSTTDYTNFSGTSAACPVAASVGAMMIVANSALTEAQGQMIMAQSCDKSGGYTYSTTTAHPNSTWSNELGYGRVNMFNAVQQAMATGAAVAPDITVTGATVNDDTPNVGQSVTINCNQVLSNGSATPSSVSLEYRWSTDQTWSSSDVVIGTDVSTLSSATSTEAESITYTVPTGTGARYILIKGDAGDGIAESSETNNVIVIPVTVSITAIILPDITLANYSVDDNTPTVGQTVTVNCQQVIVSASLSTSNVVMEYRYSSDAVWSANDVVIGTDTSALGLLLTLSSESINYTIPAGTGANYILIKTDITNVISESNELNNTYTIPLTVSAALVSNVTVANLSTTTNLPTIGQSVTVSCTQAVANPPAVATGVSIEYWWSTNQTWSTSDLLVGSGSSLLGNGISSEAESVTFIIPAGTGVRYLLAKADASDALAESDESNIYVLTFVVSAAATLPDITISSSSVSSTSPTVGQSIVISCSQVTSLSSAAVANVTLEYRWSTDQTWATTDALIGTDISALGGGVATESESTTFTVPAGTGTRYVLIKCDAGSSVSETNETNNVIVIPVTVSAVAVLPDITVSNYSVDDNTPTVGQSVAISCQQIILNPALASSNVVLEYRYSTDPTWSTGDIIIGSDTSQLGLLLLLSSESINYTIPAGTGTRYILIKADISNVIGESNELNNTYTIPVTVSAPVPDITITNLNASATSVTIGQNVTVNCIQNITNGPATAVNVGIEYRWSTDPIWSTTADALVSSASSILGNGITSESEAVTFAVPEGAGTRYLLVKADANNLVTESNESNTYVITFTVLAVPTLPDIFLDEVSITATTAEVGAQLTVSLFQNTTLSTMAGSNVFIEYRWATGTTWSSSYPLIGIDYSSIGAGDFDDDESLVFSVPAGTGQRYLIIKCDSNNSITESDENNNVYVIPVTVVEATTSNSFDGGSGEVEAIVHEVVDEDVNDGAYETMVPEDALAFSVYPNPVRDVLNIQLTRLAESTGNYEIRSMTGALVAKDYLGKDSLLRSIDVSQLEGGIYFVTIQVDGKSSIEKIIVTH